MKRRLLPILMTLILVCALPIWAAFVTSGDVTNPLVCTAGATLPDLQAKIDAAADNRYAATERSGPATAERTFDKLQGALVTSNVSLADQMVKLIETQRAYQISSRVVTTSDEFTRLANNLR